MRLSVNSSGSMFHMPRGSFLRAIQVKQVVLATVPKMTIVHSV